MLFISIHAATLAYNDVIIRHYMKFTMIKDKMTPAK